MLARLAVVLALRAGLGAEVGGAQCSAGDETCAAQAPTTPGQEHLLLQTWVGSSTQEAPARAQLEAQEEVKDCGAVSRRRRDRDMSSCRRRHSSWGFEDTDGAGPGWVCDEAANQMVCKGPPAQAPAPPSPADSEMPPPPPPLPAPGADAVLGDPPEAGTEAPGLWCQVGQLPSDWSMKTCPTSGQTTTVKVLTYNLFWWNLFDKHGGNGRSAGHLIATTSGPEQYDFMGFQECDDRYRIINDAKAEGLPGTYETIDGGHAVALAYRSDVWAYLSGASLDVGEDSKAQYYGKRSAIWGRFANGQGKTVFFMTHHGPLPVSAGGGCTGTATALNIVRTIAKNAHASDLIILVGDFNAAASSSRIQELDRRLNRVYSGTALGGIDHVFSNCASHTVGHNLGHGGSDHDALSVTFTF